MGGEGAGSGIPKEAGDREKLRKISQHCVTFCKRNRTEAGARMEEGGKREFQTPLFPSTRKLHVSQPKVHRIQYS